MDIKDEILKIYNDPSSYDAKKFIFLPNANILTASLIMNKEEIAEEVKHIIFKEEFNEFLGDVDEEMISRWKAFCNWASTFNWLKDISAEILSNMIFKYPIEQLPEKL